MIAGVTGRVQDLVVGHVVAVVQQHVGDERVVGEPPESVNRRTGHRLQPRHQTEMVAVVMGDARYRQFGAGDSEDQVQVVLVLPRTRIEHEHPFGALSRK